MKFNIFSINHLLGIGLLVAVTGCADWRSRAPSNAGSSTAASQPPIQFGAAPARITSINQTYRFAVLDFSSRAMPSIGTRLSVYRGEQRVGAVQLTEPVRSRFATADILEGELRVGDEAR